METGISHLQYECKVMSAGSRSYRIFKTCGKGVQFVEHPLYYDLVVVTVLQIMCHVGAISILRMDDPPLRRHPAALPD